MADPARRRATYEDLLAAPDDKVAQIINGELVTSPRPSGPHGVAGSALTGTLVPPLQFGDNGPGGWWILHEPELHLGEDVVVPDLAGWRVERMPDPPRGPFIELVPDWLCEVLSPSTVRVDRVRKLPLYAAAGVGHLWLIDPVARTLEGYRLQDKHWVLITTHENDEVVRVEPFESVTLDLKRLWGERP